MKVKCSPRSAINSHSSSSDISILLQEYVDQSIIRSIQQSSAYPYCCKIVVSSAADTMKFNLIRKTLNRHGYTTKAYRIRDEKKIGPSTNYSVILARVSAPKPPNKPGGFSDPGGKPPKKRK